MASITNIWIDVSSFLQDELQFSEPQGVMSLIGWAKCAIMLAGRVQKAVKARQRAVCG